MSITLPKASEILELSKIDQTLLYIKHHVYDLCVKGYINLSLSHLSNNEIDELRERIEKDGYHLRLYVASYNEMNPNDKYYKASWITTYKPITKYALTLKEENLPKDAPFPKQVDSDAETEVNF